MRTAAGAVVVTLVAAVILSGVWLRFQTNAGAVSSAGASSSTGPSVTPSASPSPMTAASPTLQSAVAVHAGTFSLAGSLPSPLGAQTATLLADGRVLIAGGTDDGSTPLASAELYDPAGGSFSQIGPMAVAGESGLAASLLDGRVLIAGVGRIGLQAELYDPKTGKFSQTGSMITQHDFGAATLLLDGRVLIVGGDVPTGNGAGAAAYAELYDPKTGKFSSTGPMATAREWFTATLLRDGRVLIAGGDNIDSGGGLASAEILHPQTGKFTAAGSMA